MLALALINVNYTLDGVEYKYDAHDILCDIKFPEDTPTSLIDSYKTCLADKFRCIPNVCRFFNEFYKYDPYISFEFVDGLIDNRKVCIIVPLANEYYNMYKIVSYNDDSIWECLIDVNELKRVSQLDTSDIVECINFFKKYGIENGINNSIEFKWLNFNSLNLIAQPVSEDFNNSILEIS